MVVSKSMPPKAYESLKDFYPFYLGEHQNRVNRALHFLGTSLVLAILAAVLLTRDWILIVYAPLAGYGFAWVGHFFFEKNRPATFRYPVYSLISDFRMYGQMWSRLISREKSRSGSK